MLSRISTIFIVSIILIVMGVVQQADTSELPRIRPIPLIRVGGAFLGSSTDLVVYVWYIEGANSRIIVDTGMIEAAGIAMGGWVVSSLDDGLARVGLTPEDVDIVLFTHLHPDHVGYASRFTNARLIVQSAELEADYLVEGHPSFDLVKDLDFETISGDQQIDDNVQVLLTPGHTPGGQSVLVETSAGKVVITGYCCTMEHFEPIVTPPPRTANPDQLIESMQRVEEIADILIPLHDYSFASIDAIPASVDTDANKAIARRFFEEAVNLKNLDVIDEIFATDFVGHPLGSPDIHGSEGVKQFLEMKFFPFDFHATVEDMFAERDNIVSRVTYFGAHQVELMGIPPTGNQITMTAIVIFHIADGKIVEDWAVADQLGLMKQLGIMPPAGNEDYTWGEPSEATGDPGDPEANKAIVQRVYEDIFDKKNLDLINELYATDYVHHVPPNPEIRGPEGLRQLFAMQMAAFPDFHIIVEDIFAEGDKVISRWTFKGTHGGELMGIPPTCKKVTMKGVVINRIADGKIVEDWESYTALGLMQQLTAPPEKDYSNVFFMPLTPGLNMISLPLEPQTPYTARSFAEEIGATVVIKYDEESGRFVGFELSAPGEGFPIEGGKGYIVNVPGGGTVTFTGAAWTNNPPVEMAPPLAGGHSVWAFVASGSVLDSQDMSASDGSYTVTVRNLKTGEVFTESVAPSGYFAIAWADLNRRAVIRAEDRVEIAVIDSSGKIVSGPFVHDITLDEIRDAVVNVHLKLGDIIPERSTLLQNYPNPFNPETWIPYRLSEDTGVAIRIYDVNGGLVRILDLGHKSAGFYTTKDKAAYWDGMNEAGEFVASGLYFYTIQAHEFSATRKMTLAK